MKSHLIRGVVVLALSSPLAVVLTAPAAAGGGFCRGVPVTDTSTDRVFMVENCFTPTIVRIDAGQSVTWTNKDGTTHAVVGANASWGDYEEIAQAGRTTVRFAKSGVYPYFCYIHPGMIGAVVVGDGAASSASASVPLAPSTQPTDAVVVPVGAVARTAPANDGSSPVWRITAFVAIGVLVALAAWMGVGRRIVGGSKEGRRNLGRSLS